MQHPLSSHTNIHTPSKHEISIETITKPSLKPIKAWLTWSSERLRSSSIVTMSTSILWSSASLRVSSSCMSRTCSCSLEMDSSLEHSCTQKVKYACYSLEMDSSCEHGCRQKVQYACYRSCSACQHLVSNENTNIPNMQDPSKQSIVVQKGGVR